SGTYYLHIKAIDKVENTAIVSSDGFNIDNIAPNISLTPNGNSGYVGEKSCDVRIEITDQISSSTDITAWYAISEDKASYGEMTPLTSEVITIDTVNVPKYLTIKATDKAGNEAVIQSEPFMPDTTAPKGTISKTEDKYYINTNTVNVKISASDDYSSTILMQIKVDDTESEWEEYETTKALIFDETEREHTISVRFKDKSDNISDYVSAIYCYDVTAPEISFDYSPSTLTNQSVTVTATAFDDKSETKFTTEATKVFDVNGSFEFIAYDEAGNIARKTAKVDYIDKTKPTISITSDCFDGKKHRDAKVKIEASDENGIDNLEYAIVKNGEEPSEMTECRNGEEILISGLDGAYQIAVRATDGVGNTDLASSQSILFDNTVPTAAITYEPSKRTARDVVATVTFNEDTIITNNGGKNTYTFTDNDEFTFEYKDDAGNIGSKTAKVTWIDRSSPCAKVILSHDSWTNEDITVTLLPQPQSIIQNVKFNDTPLEDNELNTYTFSEYGILEYEIYDIETEIITEDSVIVKVDRDAPTVKEVHYSETEWTNKDVTVSIDAEDDLSEIEYVNGKTHTFSENGSHTFIVSDSAGNTTEETVSVDFIDKDTPVATITYYADGKVYDTTTPTNKNVNAVVTFNDGGSPVSMVNNDGSFEHEFDSNGSFKFMFTDEAGNTDEIEAVVSKIDKIAPTGYVTYSKSSWTNTDVVATLHTSDDANEVTVTNNASSENYTFTDNGEFIFEFKDAAGNTASAKAEVSIIDKKKPTLSYTLSTNDPTPFSVFATVTADERVTFKNNDGKPSRQFTSNGEYKFEAVDRAGNTAEINVVVTNISKETTPVKLVYSKTEPTNEDVFVTIEPQDGKSYIYVTNNNGQKTKRFSENGEFTFTYKNAIGIEGEATASVTNIDKEPPIVTISYSHNSVTNEDVIVTFNCSENVEYPYVVIDNKYAFTKNGKIQFPVKDKVGNVTNVIAETVLIDKNPPKIQVETPYEVIALGDAIDVMQGVTVSDENELNGEIVVTGAVDTSESGTYTITYSAVDIAGNVGEAQKHITVYDPNEFNVFVNGQLALENQINLNGKKLDITAMNVKGKLVAKYHPGKKAVGDFKTKGTKISLDGELPSVGYYTIYLRDDDRNARLVYVFVQE
ncbi:MAG: Ig-like domain repeat protein, partial [Monoglobaceae bacterium]